MSDRSRWFVPTAWLAEHLHDRDLVVVDGSWYLGSTGRSAGAEYLQRHIPGAVFFDIDAIADLDTTLPHMLPPPEEFAAEVGALGIDASQPIVVYDSEDLYSAPRVWWTLKVMGARNVRILDGGLRKWITEGRPVVSGRVIRDHRTFVANPDLAAVADLAAVKARLADHGAQVVDGRPAARFRGEAPEPRPGVRSGHMPGALSLPGVDLLANGLMKDAAALAATFAAAGVDPAQPIVTSCGSGVVAAKLALAAEMLGARDVKLYDGSWTEWGSDPALPTALGPAKPAS